MDERTIQDIAREFGPTMRELKRHLDTAQRQIAYLKEGGLIDSPQVGLFEFQKLEGAIVLFSPFLKEFIQEIEKHEDN